jgi:hypothetical protein
VDIGTDETGFNIVYGPGATRQCKLFASRVGTDQSVIGDLQGVIIDFGVQDECNDILTSSEYTAPTSKAIFDDQTQHMA